MPNHVHGIVIIRNNNDGNGCGRRDVAMQRLYRYDGKHPAMSKISPESKSLSVIIRSFKSIVSKTVNQKFPNIQFQWQSRFYDHIIRNEKSLKAIRIYIKTNSSNWKQDRNNPLNINVQNLLLNKNQLRKDVY
jgi:REP element-mobilizing transposase RayT